MNNPRNSSRIYRLVFFVILLKLSLLPFFQNTDSDAVTRIYMSINWMEHPEWIRTSIWGPFHFYLTGFFLYLWNNPVYTPSIINILLSSLSLFPFYYFTKREFSKNGAMIASVLFAFSPILFRNGFMGLSETPYLFFLILCLNFLSKAIKEKSISHFIYAGLSITIAAGFRYEAWLLIPIFSFVVWIKDKFKHAFVFGMIALLFPVVWMFQNQIDKGNAFYSLQGNYDWTMELMKNNEGLNWESYLRRLWFFPFSWMISLGPLAAILAVLGMIRTFNSDLKFKSLRVWCIPFILLLLFFEYNSFKGVLLLQPRFTGTLVALSLPFIAIYFDEWNLRKNKIAISSVILMIGLSFVYNMKGVSPVPKIGRAHV